MSKQKQKEQLEDKANLAAVCAGTLQFLLTQTKEQIRKEDARIWMFLKRVIISISYAPRRSGSVGDTLCLQNVHQDLTLKKQKCTKKIRLKSFVLCVFSFLIFPF